MNADVDGGELVSLHTEAALDTLATCSKRSATNTGNDGAHSLHKLCLRPTMSLFLLSTDDVKAGIAARTAPERVCYRYLTSLPTHCTKYIQMKASSRLRILSEHLVPEDRGMQSLRTRSALWSALLPLHRSLERAAPS